MAGDVAERTDEIRWALDLLRKRFAKVIWIPGNHELWTTKRDPMQIFGRARYDYLVNMCDEMGIVTPEHPYPVWTEEGGPATIVPMFLLYDYSFLPQGAATKAEGLAIARENATSWAPTSSCCRRSPTPRATPGAATGSPTPASGSRTWTG